MCHPCVLPVGAENSGSPVEVSSMSDSDQGQFVPGRIELINDAVITHAKSICVRTFHAVMRKAMQPSPHVVNLLLHTALDIRRQCVEPLIELLGVNRCRRTGAGRTHGLRTRTRPAAISALPAAISSLNASVISRWSSSKFSSQSRNSSCSRRCSFRTASWICSRLLTAEKYYDLTAESIKTTFVHISGL